MVKPESDIVQDEHHSNIGGSATSARRVILTNTAGAEYNVGGAGDGAIVDGVTSSIKATVLDYASSKPLAVRLTDTAGTYVAAGGGGEQYADNIAVNASYKGTIALGTDGSNYQMLLVDSSGRLQINVINASLAVTQSGTWNIGTVTTLTGITNAVAVTGTFWQATQPVSGTFWQATQPVSGTFWQATQPVSLASVPTHAVSQSGTWTVNGEVIWDYMSLTQDATHDTYVFKTGGAGGTTVQTITITYTDSTKATISTVVKS